MECVGEIITNSLSCIPNHHYFLFIVHNVSCFAHHFVLFVSGTFTGIVVYGAQEYEYTHCHIFPVTACFGNTLPCILIIIHSV